MALTFFPVHLTLAFAVQHYYRCPTQNLDFKPLIVIILKSDDSLHQPRSSTAGYFCHIDFKCMDQTLIGFKYLKKSTLRREGFTLAHGSRT